MALVAMPDESPPKPPGGIMFAVFLLIAVQTLALLALCYRRDGFGSR